MKKDVVYIVNFIKKYQERLQNTNKLMMFSHSLTKVACNPIDDRKCFTCETSISVIPALSELDAVTRDMIVYEPALLNDNDKRLQTFD